MIIRRDNLHKTGIPGFTFVKSLVCSIYIGIVSITLTRESTLCIKKHKGSRIPLTEAQFHIKACDHLHPYHWDQLSLENSIHSDPSYLAVRFWESRTSVEYSDTIELSTPPHIVFLSLVLKNFQNFCLGKDNT